jgi:hypothetical protein
MAVVGCKLSLTFLKTSLFVSYHPQNTRNNNDVINGYKRRSYGGVVDLENEDDTRRVRKGAPGDGGVVMRWGGFGIQVGGLIGAIAFFVLTVVLGAL